MNHYIYTYNLYNIVHQLYHFDLKKEDINADGNKNMKICLCIIHVIVLISSGQHRTMEYNYTPSRMAKSKKTKD